MTTSGHSDLQKQMQMSRHQISKAMKNMVKEGVFDSSGLDVSYDTGKLKAGNAEFSLKSPTEMAFIAEMVMLMNVINNLPDNSLVEDSAPDMITLSFKSVAPLLMELADALETQETILKLLDSVITQLETMFQKVYRQQGVVGILIRAAPDAALVQEIRHAVWSVVEHHVTNKEAFKRVFPSVYLSTGNIEEVCRLVQSAVETTAQVFCGENRRTRVLQAAAAEKLTYDSVDLFQITLWTTILLCVSVLFSIIALFNMELGADTILFAKGKDKSS